jgi:hypothetical protein
MMAKLNPEPADTQETRMAAILVVDDGSDACHNMADVFGNLGYAKGISRAFQFQEISPALSA